MNHDSRWIRTVSNNCLCTGCGLCQAYAGPDKLSVEISSEGYFRPRQLSELTANTETVLREICPGIHIEHDPNQINGSYHPIWGPYRRLLRGMASDPRRRHMGSSGGAITALAAYLLDSGKVDFILHNAPSAENPLYNTMQKSGSSDDLMRGTGSRYSPSAPLINFMKFLSEPGHFGLIAKPCDLAALHNYAKFDPRVSEKIRYTLSFFCAGVPSLNGTRSLIAEFGIDEAELKSLRYRGHGWPGSFVVETKGGKRKEMSYEASWDLLAEYLQFRCKICPDGVGEFSDVSCGDAWHLTKDQPDFSERPGVSVILSRTDRGDRLVEEAIDAGYLSVSNLDFHELDRMQPHQSTRKKHIKARVFALSLLGIETPNFGHIELDAAAKLSGVRSRVRAFFGTMTRILFGLSYETPRILSRWLRIGPSKSARKKSARPDADRRANKK